jgi:hypothetical protein
VGRCPQLPLGTYVLEMEAGYGPNTFSRLYLAFGSVKQWWSSPHVSVKVLDGAHMYLHFGGCMLLLCTMDGNRRMIISGQHRKRNKCFLVY